MSADLIKNIYTAKEECRLSVFVGAGVSKTTEFNGKKLPSWSELINEFSNSLGIVNENDYLKLAQLYYLEYGEFTYYKKLKDFFDIDVEPSLVHSLILKLNPQYIITTNWDNILEKEISNSLGLYDIVASDADLAKSLLPKKLIKMHGDFEHHNIVFKEDDYLNYEYNFPLISNYVKGILSTNAVLFLGYSYNDIDLKSILMWLRNNTKARPPMYLVTFNENASQIKYLENQGVKTIVLGKDYLVEQKFNLDDYSNRLASFLNRIVDYRAHRESSNINCFSYILNKLAGLGEFEYILQDHIVNSLGNCGFLYSGELVILRFYDQILTGDYDKEARSIYSSFINLLKDSEKNKTDFGADHESLLEIFKILDKAGISGVLISEEDENNKQYIPLVSYIEPKECNEIETIFNFDISNRFPDVDNMNDLLKSGFMFFQSERYSQSLKATEIALRLATREKQYGKLLITAKNYGNLKRLIEIDIDNNSESENTSFPVFREVVDYYGSFPYKVQNDLKLFFETLDNNYCKGEAYKAFISLDKISSKRSIIENGGFSFDSEQDKPKNIHKKLLYFFLGNGVFADFIPGFKDINKSYIKVSFSHQITTGIIHLEKFELYSLLVFFKKSELISIFNEFFEKRESDRPTLSISEENIEWLVYKVFKNLLHGREDNKTVGGYINQYIENLMCLLSYIELKEVYFNEVLESVQRIITMGRCGVGIYEVFNRFIAIQYNTFSPEFNNDILTRMIVSIIDKFSRGNTNGYDRIAVEQNYLGNIYGIAKEKNIFLTDIKVINRLVFEIKNTGLVNQYSLSESFLIDLHAISSDKIKKSLMDYFIYLNEKVIENPVYEGVIFHLMLIVNDIKEFEDKDLQVLKSFLDNDGNKIEPYKLVGKFENIINYLSIEKNLSGYNDLMTEFNLKSIVKVNDNVAQVSN
ncbi:SIR2 family protein [Photobacterium phosphoreum]|uniref:SIR2 family protein n=1 Tax=Photobacterium phosphoreum TaxID=659 RepID=UPI0024330606|nr:SIR2 family protein [Photobacterium phosphoreum]